MTYRTCRDCRREITAELVEIGRLGGMLNSAADSEEGFMPVEEPEMTVRLSCSCGHVDVGRGSGKTAAWDIPDGWIPVEEAEA